MTWLQQVTGRLSSGSWAWTGVASSASHVMWAAARRGRHRCGSSPPCDERSRGRTTPHTTRSDMADPSPAGHAQHQQTGGPSCSIGRSKSAGLVQIACAATCDLQSASCSTKTISLKLLSTGIKRTKYSAVLFAWVFFPSFFLPCCSGTL